MDTRKQTTKTSQQVALAALAEARQLWVAHMIRMVAVLWSLGNQALRLTVPLTKSTSPVRIRQMCPTPRSVGDISGQ